jgi:hypothetical protein
VKFSKVVDYPIADLAPFLQVHKKSKYTIKEIIEKPSLNTAEYNEINNSDINQPIVILRDNGILYFCDGIYQLARAFILKNEMISVKFITRHQLQKAVIGGDDSKKPEYYIFGVEQNNLLIRNIGAGHSIAAALNITFYEFIEKIIVAIRRETGLFSMLYHGKLLNYFSSSTEFVKILHSLFIDERDVLDEKLYKFMGWNELFIELTDRFFNIRVLILDDVSVEIPGKLKGYKIAEDINVILPGKFDSIETLIQPQFEYILLLRRKKKSNILFAENHIYYPIFILMPQLFFKKFLIEKRIYMSTDEIIKLLKIIFTNSFHVNQEAQEINLDITEKFCEEKNIEIVKYYVNNRNLCYACELKSGGATIIWPIKLSYTNAKNTSNVPYNRVVSANFMALARICKLFNEFITTIAEKKNMYQISPSESDYKHKLNQREKKVMPGYLLIKIQKFLWLENKIIGFIGNGLYYYFAAIHENAFAKLINLALKIDGYSILIDRFLDLHMRATIYRLRYDPNKINAALKTNCEHKEFSMRLYKALYNVYLYDLFVIAVINKSEKKLKDWREISNDFQSADKKEIHMKLVKDIHQFIIEKKILHKVKQFKMFEKSTFPNILMPCDSYESDEPPKYCTNGKLIVSVRDLPILVDIFAADLCNPLKRDYLLNSVVMENIRNYFTFAKYPGEDIYILA